MAQQRGSWPARFVPPFSNQAKPLSIARTSPKHRWRSLDEHGVGFSRSSIHRQCSFGVTTLSSDARALPGSRLPLFPFIFWPHSLRPKGEGQKMKGKKQTTAGMTRFPNDWGKEAASPRCFFVRGLQESARTSSPIAWSCSGGSNAEPKMT